MSNQRTKEQRERSDWRGILMLILLLPLIIVILTLHFLASVSLHVAIWCCWCTRGRDVLLVYSDSPIWREHIDQHVLPRLEKRAFILNWSQRNTWRRTLSTMAFRFFGGKRDFNPMVVVFRPFRIARKFRFFQPFREFKHGRTEAVAKMERELFDLLEKAD